MRDFKDCSAAECFETLYALLARSTLLSGAPVEAFIGLLKALNVGDMLLASQRYHALSRALLDLPARRVSGDLWQDYLLYTLLQCETPFSQVAAAGRMDDAVYMAMADELAVLGRLSTLRGSDLVRMILERQRELQLRYRHPGDSISMVTTSLWSGAETVPKVSHEPAGATAAPYFVPQGMQWAAWQYGKAGLRDDFCADEGLEELYVKLLNNPDWRNMIEHLRSFFAAYGSGPFLEGRLFCYRDIGLRPLPEAVAAPLEEPFLYPLQHQTLLDAALRFAAGAPGQPMLLIGGAGTGKTAEVFALVDAIPALRLVLVEAEPASLPVLMERLGAQPCRFLALFDDVGEERLRSLSRTLCGLRAVPGNVLLCATAREGEAMDFGMRVDFPYLSTQELVGYVTAILEGEGLFLNSQAVQRACLATQDACDGRLGIQGAKGIASQLLLGR